MLFLALSLAPPAVIACGSASTLGTGAGVDAGQSVARCAVAEGDATVIYTATVGFTGTSSQLGPNAGVVTWMDDAGNNQSCGPDTCGAQCPSGQACSVAFITRSLLATGTCP